METSSQPETTEQEAESLKPVETTPESPPRLVDILTVILGMAAAIGLLCAFLVIGGALVFQSVRAVGLPLLARTSPTGTEIPSPATPAATPTLPTRTPTITPTVTPTAILPLELNPSIPASPFEEGPWLLIRAPDGLWALSYDAFQMVQLNGQALLGPRRLASAVAPSGGHLAYILPAGPQDPEGLLLVIQHMPDGERKAAIPLTPEKSTPTTAKNAGQDARRAILEMDSLSWSPDGRRLVFTGMNDNLSADLYLYSTDDNKTIRLTSSSQHEINPRWSPDSNLVIYESAIQIREESRASLRALEAVDAGNGAVIPLYQTGSQGEKIAGWLDHNTAILSDDQPDCGSTHLQAVKITNGVSNELNEGCFSSVLYDEGTRNLFFSVSRSLAEDCPCSGAKNEAGIYLLPGGLGLPQKIAADSVLEMQSIPGYDGFFARTEGGWTLSFNWKGEKLDIPSPVQGLLPAVAPASEIRAWSGVEGSLGLGLWIGAVDETPHKIFAGSPYQPRWAPGGQTLIFFSGSDLYAALAPGFALHQLTSFPAGKIQSAWLSP